MKTCWRLFCLLILPFAALAQNRHIKFEHFQTDAGLSQSNILSIVQDSRGFMWFGTRNGLNKYDGYKFTVYKNDVNDSTSLINDQVNDLIEDDDGNIWLATLNGLDMFDWKQEKFIHYYYLVEPIVTQGNIVNSVSMDHEGNIWIGTAGSGMSMVNRKTKKIT